MKFLFTIGSFLILMNCLSAQDMNWTDATDLYRVSPFLSYETLDLSRHTLELGVADDCRSKYYVIEYYVPITVIARDPYNNGRTNFAIPLIPLYFLSRLKSHINIKEFNAKNIFMALLSSQHHIFLWDEPRIVHEYKPQWLSIFFRQNVQWFALRANQWFDISPSLGLCFYYVDRNPPPNYIPPRIGLELGISKNFSTNFNTTRSSTVYFVSLRIYGPPK